MAFLLGPCVSANVRDGISASRSERGGGRGLRKGEIVVNEPHEIDSMDCVRAFSNCAYREVLLKLEMSSNRERDINCTALQKGKRVPGVSLTLGTEEYKTISSCREDDTPHDL